VPGPGGASRPVALQLYGGNRECQLRWWAHPLPLPRRRPNARRLHQFGHFRTQSVAISGADAGRNSNLAGRAPTVVDDGPGGGRRGFGGGPASRVQSGPGLDSSCVRCLPVRGRQLGGRPDLCAGARVCAVQEPEQREPGGDHRWQRYDIGAGRDAYINGIGDRHTE